MSFEKMGNRIISTLLKLYESLIKNLSKDGEVNNQTISRRFCKTHRILN